jgi:hypothetical protein
MPCGQPESGDECAPSAWSQPPQHTALCMRRACLDTRHVAALAEPGARQYPQPEDGVFSVFLVECKQ